MTRSWNKIPESWLEFVYRFRWPLWWLIILVAWFISTKEPLLSIVTKSP